MLLGFIFVLDFFFYFTWMLRLSLEHTTYVSINAIVRCGNEHVEMCVVMYVDDFKLCGRNLGDNGKELVFRSCRVCKIFPKYLDFFFPW